MKTQLRGHCQCCGRDQAVRGRLATHGYIVENGWFSGACSGDRHPPIEKSREQADKIIADILAEIPKLIAEADDLRAGKEIPYVMTEPFFNYTNAQIYKMEANLRGRARSGADFVKHMQSIADKYHGKPLMEVEMKEPTAPIVIGERRKRNGKVIVSLKMDGAKVYFKYEGIGNLFLMSKRKWRGLDLA